MGSRILNKSAVATVLSLIFLICSGFTAYTPQTYALSGGTWKKNDDGNWTYMNADGQTVRNSWVKDGTTVFYVGYDGVLVKDNYTPDGYYADSDGAWDQTKEYRENDVTPYEGVYEGTGNVFIFSMPRDGRQDSVQMANKTGEVYANCSVTSVGHGCMMVWENGNTDEYDQILMSVSDDRQTVRVSYMGVTEICIYNPNSSYSGQSGINYQSKSGSGDFANQGSSNNNTSNIAYSEGFVFPYSDTQLLSAADVQFLSDWQIRVAINEIYARHGRKFKDAELQNYFDSCSWYYGIYEPDEFTKMQDSLLNDIEKKNINTLVNERESRK